ncbi:hypothetical protein ASG43_12760 [Aureimonas sp. Leaf454]|uniref:hypothetical protein n=1 Tax=Aureimonas sp. Leaf454 TaxID=1736381 RepID=UPI0006FCC45E|nr:hypothetical protein [Aureimonas sp. Leaf454]KQT45158.1 hypothetical protein ASG43_12760 [Aureimonas sp. Leaf454]
MSQTSMSFAAVLADTEANSPRRRIAARSWLTFERVFIASTCSLSIGFLVFAYTVSTNDPDYFTRRILSSMRPVGLDPIETGTISTSPAEGGDPMPGPRIVRDRPLEPGDYQIVMVFEREAILATPNELMRVKVGSVLPGLGAVTGIEASDAGGVVSTTQATLRSVAD